MLGNWQALRAFIDSFQGSYKNGVAEGRYDCRYFSVVFFLVRILHCIIYGLTTSEYFYGVSLFCYITLILILVMARPYREVLSHCLKLDVLFISCLSLWNASLILGMIARVKAIKYLRFTFAVCGIVCVVPAMYIPVLLLRRMMICACLSIRWPLRLISHHKALSDSESMGNVDVDKPGLSARLNNYGSLSVT